MPRVLAGTDRRSAGARRGPGLPRLRRGVLRHGHHDHRRRRRHPDLRPGYDVAPAPVVSAAASAAGSTRAASSRLGPYQVSSRPLTSADGAAERLGPVVGGEAVRLVGQHDEVVRRQVRRVEPRVALRAVAEHVLDAETGEHGAGEGVRARPPSRACARSARRRGAGRRAAAGCPRRPGRRRSTPGARGRTRRASAPASAARRRAVRMSVTYTARPASRSLSSSSGLFSSALASTRSGRSATIVAMSGFFVPRTRVTPCSSRSSGWVHQSVAPTSRPGRGHGERLGERGDEADHPVDGVGERDTAVLIVDDVHAPRVPPGVIRYRRYRHLPRDRRHPRGPLGVGHRHRPGCSSSSRRTGWSCTGCCSATDRWTSRRCASGWRSGGSRSTRASASGRPGPPAASVRSGGSTTSPTSPRTSTRWTSPRPATTRRWPSTSAP